ncbi:glycoside hydrolase family 32 protein [Mesoplasma seiffertii]|uniref:glycoside hydrolase family 32 protein n=1 Tax=Mesoplasma seiffertii TaxID=28224 RepID=UPI00146FB89F|nr:GH32 C-terminal domain-containing protein [Mesoplasma seiffertii]
MNKINQHDLKDLKAAEELVAQDKSYRPLYHIAPPHGLLNDPNGLIYKDGYHHVHYQWSPIQPYHGMKHWYYLKTKDFVNYLDLGVSIIPEHEGEITGAFSGSAFETPKGVKIYYTGNIEDGMGNMLREVQISADLVDDKIVNKRIAVEHDPELFTPHARDPKIFKYQDQIYMIFGVQCQADKLGGLALYKTEDYETFVFDRILKPTLENQDYGYMWECPNLDLLGDQLLFMISAEGWFNPQDEYELNNSRNVVYTAIKSLDLEHNQLGESAIMKTMDYGHDFYAPQTYWCNNKLLMIGWLGAVDVQYPTDKYSWHSMLTIPRELSWNKNILVQRPFSEFKHNILENSKTAEIQTLKVNKALHLEFDLNDELIIEVANAKGEKLQIEFAKTEIILDRSKETAHPTWDFEGPRKALRKLHQQTVEIYLDASSIEIFADNYQTIFTSRFFVENFDEITFSKATSVTVSNVKTINYQK